jgi:RNA polymerase sigma factor (sigma-70 family)
VGGSPGGREAELRLHAGLLAGEPAALAELYERYGSLVYAVALRLVRDPAAAEDVIQDVFEQVWRRPGGYDPAAGPLPAWLALLARRRAIDAIRRSARQQRRVASQPAAANTAPDPAEAAVDAALASSLRAAVEALPPAQHTAVLLAYGAGLTAREIATRLGIPEGTVKSRLRLGLRRLGRLLAADGFVDVRSSHAGMDEGRPKFAPQ